MLTSSYRKTGNRKDDLRSNFVSNDYQYVRGNIETDNPLLFYSTPRLTALECSTENPVKSDRPDFGDPGSARDLARIAP
jgi:hypothetical protein